MTDGGSEPELYTPSQQGSFWEVNQYKRVVKRAEDGYKRCNELIMFLTERAELEKIFSKQLRTWSKRWSDFLDRGTEYGSTLGAWRGFLHETNRKADVHSEISDKLREVIPRIKTWQKDSYVRSVILNKTVREFDDDFKKAQKAWAKAYLRSQKCKKDYYSSCKMLNAVKAQEESSKNDASLSAENKRKIVEKLERSKKETETNKHKYQQSINELDQLQPKYVYDMQLVFDRTQEFENERLKFFKETFLSALTCIDISKDNNFFQIYEDLLKSIEAIDPTSDLIKWSKTYGADMPMNWPEFEEYVENPCKSNLRRGNKFLNSLNSRTAVNLDAGKDLNGQSEHEEARHQEEFPSNKPHASSRNSPVEPQLVYAPISSPMPLRNNKSSKDNEQHVCGSIRRAVSREELENNQVLSDYPEAQNPFNDPVNDNCQIVLPVSPKDGIRMRALYDYDAQEDDELNLKVGMEFLMIEEEDEQGWCKGRIGTTEGLYPAAYAVPL